MALPPTLHRGMIAVAQSASQRADAASIGDDLQMVHEADVRITRTLVNVECVRSPGDKVYVSDDHNTGEALSGLVTRAGLSLKAFAKAAGYAGASSIQRYVEDSYRKRLSMDVAERFSKALAGKGSPPITAAEVLALAGIGALPAPNAKAVAFEGDGLEDAPENLPVWGTGLGAARTFDGEAVEQTDLNSGNVIEYVKRPAIVKGKKFAYALHVQGSSMEPMFDDGEMVVAVRDMPLSSGDGVVVYLRDGNEDDGLTARGVLVKRLIRRSASWVELRQYVPDLVFRVPMDQVLRVDRILTRKEMLL